MKVGAPKGTILYSTKGWNEGREINSGMTSVMNEMTNQTRDFLKTLN